MLKLGLNMHMQTKVHKIVRSQVSPLLHMETILLEMLQTQLSKKILSWVSSNKHFARAAAKHPLGSDMPLPDPIPKDIDFEIHRLSCITRFYRAKRRASGAAADHGIHI